MAGVKYIVDLKAAASAMQTLDRIPTEIEVLPPSALVRVFRDSDVDIRYRECLIFLDGKEVGDLFYRQHLELEVEPGTHTIQASNRVLRSKKITFTTHPGSRVTFQTGNMGGGCFMLLCILLQMGVPRVFLNMETAEGAAGDEYAIPESLRLT